MVYRTVSEAVAPPCSEALHGLDAISWPEGKPFAFTIFDDPDSQTLEAGQAVYDMLADYGFRTTKGVWPVRGNGQPSDHGLTCADPRYRLWVRSLQAQGFEIALHNVTSHTSSRHEIRAGLERFAAYFGTRPRSMANHYFCDESLYWGDSRLTGFHRAAYNLLTAGRNRRKSHGHDPEHPCFWGDMCRETIQYVRNFVFGRINTLRACPFMPHYDPERPYVNAWFASSEGANVRSFNERLSESNQDLLEAEGGACIMYAHFGHGFHDGKRVNRRFRFLMERLARKSGWFVPVSELLDYLAARRGIATITDRDRRTLERQWLLHKVCYGTA